MSGATATPKQTGGAGYSFEDYTGAYFCIRLLQGGYPLEPLLGTLRSIKFQNNVDKWLLDDVLLTLDDACGQRQCGLSVKSNVQFGKSTAPQGFVKAVWAMYLREGTEVFTKGRDLLGLVTAPLPSETRVPLMELLRLAKSQPPEDLARRLLDKSRDAKGYASQKVRRIFKSFSCPQQLAKKYGVSDAETAALLKQLIFCQFDFLEPHSYQEANCLANCQDLLRNGRPENAANLWASLLKTVNEVRTAGGALDRARLVDLLRSSHELAEFPDLRHDWQRLSLWGRERLEALPDAIGGSVRLQRQQLVSRVSDAMRESRFVAVIGESGAGKSVICKSAAQRISGSAAILWFSSDTFVNPLEALYAELGLTHSLSQVFRGLAAQRGLMVLDGLERLASDESWWQVRQLLQHAEAGKAASPWFLLLSCRSEDWASVQARLLQAGVPLAAVHVEEVGSLDPEDLNQVLEAFPLLAQVIFLDHLRPLITKPKILDVFARHSELLSRTDTERWSGESDLAEWYWREVIRKGNAGDARSAFLQKMAEQQADSNHTTTSVVDIPPPYQPLLSELERDGTCNVEHERVSFSHDLLADWSRLRLLIALRDELASYLSTRALNPQWHQAIRLYGMWLLEQESAEAWTKEYGRLESIAPAFFDSTFLAVGTRQHLETLWPQLIAGNGELLRLVLVRFLHRATYPHPLAAKIAQTEDRELTRYMSAHLRVPLWSYWLPVLQTLSAHQDEVIALAPQEVAQIAPLWLQNVSPEWPLRQEAARLALAIGEGTFLGRLGHSYDKSEKDMVKYKAALAAARELPNEVADFALRAAARRLIPEVEQNPESGYLPPGSVITSNSIIYCEDRVVPKPWPDGPLYRVDETFRHTCLSEAALQVLMIERPAIAKEVILALLILPPTPELVSYSDPLDFGKNLHITSGAEFVHAFYLDGPFLLFLSLSWEDALDCILRLVDFATDNWTDNLSSQQGAYVPIYCIASLRGPRFFAGDAQVLSWYRGPWGNKAVKSALQALEKWFYDSLEKESDVAEKAIELILARAHSAAFLGMLWEIGRLHPDLLKGPLKPLLACARLYSWEEQLAKDLAHIGLITSPCQLKERLRLIVEWETMPHREVEVRNLAIRFLLQSEEEAEFFEGSRRQWSNERDFASLGAIPPEWYGNLIAQFDPANWTDADPSNAGSVMQFNPPKEMSEQWEQQERRRRELEPYSIARACRDVLDSAKVLETEHSSLFLEKLQELAASDPGTESEQRSVVAAVCGGMAVLLHTQFAWLHEVPEREEWCRTTLLDALASLQPDTSPWAEYGESGLSAEDFAAEAIVVFWAAAPTDKQLRESVAALLASKRRSVTGRLVRAAFARREEIGPSFDQLVHLAIRWAELSHDLAVEEWRAGPVAQAESWKQQYVSQFIDGSLSPDPGRWGQAAVERGRRTPAAGKDHGRRRHNESGVYRIEPHVHRVVLLKTFDGILMPDQARDDEERKKWFGFWRQVLQCELAEMRSFDSDGNIVEFLRAEAHIPQIDCFAKTFAHLILRSSSQDAEHFWKPVLDLGPPGGLWLQWFLIEFFREGLSRVSRTIFVPTWRAMIAYASRSAAWRYSDARWYDLDQLWLHLLGLAPPQQNLWQSQHMDVVEAMRGTYEQLMPPYLSSNWFAGSFIDWLRKPATAPMRLQALTWLLPVAQDANGWWWGEDTLQDDLSEVLAISWEEHRPAILANSDIRDAHRTLVALLVKRNNRLAMDLQDKMASGQ